MISRDLISNAIPTIKTSDTGDDVINLMQIYHVRHLPIVNHEDLLGVLSEEDILIHDPEESIGSYRLSYLRPYVFDTEHIFEVMAKLAKFQLTVIPVIDEDEKYLGAITIEDLIKFFASQYSFAETGSIIVLETMRHDYSLAEIARIAESEDVMILSSFTTGIPESQKLYITLKVNTQDINNLKSTYERFGYQIAGTYAEVEYFDNLKERYDSLMKYLNV
jgi:acetoin utilization protein AcuB